MKMIIFLNNDTKIGHNMSYSSQEHKQIEILVDANEALELKNAQLQERIYELEAELSELRQSNIEGDF